MLRTNLAFNVSFINYFDVLQLLFDKDNCKFLLIFCYCNSELIT